MVGVAWSAVHEMNAKHAKDFAAVTKDEALAAVAANSAAAAAAIRAMSDEDLDRAVPQSLYGDAELTCQFFLEDHAVRHRMHHLARIKAALQ
jgi:cystathionine beta-lyase/cystathionine gamma-synthase